MNATTGAIYFTSDPHFGHKRIIELCDRPFDDVDEMNEALIANWNSVVRPEDTVYCLGDLVMGPFAEGVAATARLNGDKRLVPGNHDRVSSCYKGSDAKKHEWLGMYLAAGWTVLPEEFELVLEDGLAVTVSHFPFDGDSHGEDRYGDKRPEDRGQVVIHGHVHGEWDVKGRQINVGVDVRNFQLVPLETIIDETRQALAG